jgi:PTH1 family peptidyl-tRNA hydrolase
MGIGRPIGEQDPVDFVLKPFSKEERKDIPEFIQRGADAVEELVLNGLDKAQTAFNS